MITNTPDQEIIIEVELPNHDVELENIKNYIDQLKNRYKMGTTRKKLTITEYERIRDLTLNTLELVGKLSMPAFNIEDELEEKYVMAYRSSPQLAKTLWLDHYERIHRKYNTLKNRCYKILDELESSINKLKKNIKST